MLAAARQASRRAPALARRPRGAARLARGIRARPLASLDAPAAPALGLEERKKRILYRCKLRGLLELDLLLGVFAKDNIDRYSAEELDRFEALSLEETPDLMKWALAKEEAPPEYRELLRDIQHFAFEGTKEWAPQKGQGNQ